MLELYSRKELNVSTVASILFKMADAKVLRPIKLLILENAVQLEHGVFYSHTLREYLQDSRSINLGSYSYGNLRDY